jgi:hypothetical protein
MSARSFSYSNLSLKDQELYLKCINLKIDEYPLLFGTFCHNTDSNKSTTFSSKFYKYTGSKLESLPFEIVNMRETNYSININPVSNMISLNLKNEMNTIESVINKLRDSINNSVNEIENKHQRMLMDMKLLLKNELEENKRLFEKLKTFQN